MVDAKSRNSFVFVHTGGRVSVSKEGRHAIRKQAMSRPAAARRKKGNWGKINLLQYPASDLEGRSPKPNVCREEHQRSGEDSKSRTNLTADDIKILEVASTASTRSGKRAIKIAPKMPSTGYEALRCQLDFDVLDISCLTTFHVSGATALHLAQQPSQLIHVIRCRQWSFLDYVPSRWGNTPCLDAVTKCVMSRVQEYARHSLESPSQQTLALYVKAVCSVQAALDDCSKAVEPDVLCAIRLLAIWELLPTSQPNAWDYHMSGAIALLKLKGPASFHSPYEKSLLLAMVGPMYTEAMMEGNETFLDEEPWQTTLHSCAMEPSGFSDCSELTVVLWLILSPVPRLYRDVQNLICGVHPYKSITRQLIQSYIQRARLTLQRLQTWRESYDTLLRAHCDGRSEASKRSNSLSVNVESELDKSYELLAICLGSEIVLNRLLIALDPTQPDTSFIEARTQEIGLILIGLEKQATRRNPRAALFMRFKLKLAQSVLSTKEWADVAAKDDDQVDDIPIILIDREIFEKWCRMKGRRIPSD